MSIPAQGRRRVFFPPPGARIRTTLAQIILTPEPVEILEQDSRRVLASIALDMATNRYAAFASNKDGFGAMVQQYGSSNYQYWFYGGEALWGMMSDGTPTDTVVIQIQQIFYD